MGYEARSRCDDYYIRNPGMYRKDLRDEIGTTPDSWEDVRVGGAKLKKLRHPVGISLGHSVDPNTAWRAVLWSYGGSVQDEAGKHVVLDSKQTLEALKYAALSTRRPWTLRCYRGTTPATIG